MPDPGEAEEELSHSWSFNVPSLYLLTAREGVAAASQADQDLAEWRSQVGEQHPISGKQPNPDISKRHLIGCATAHLFAAASAEAYVNQIAQAKLGTNEFKRFKNLAVYWKWRMLPALLGAEPFEVGTGPLVGIGACIDRRNALAHCKLTESTGPLSPAELLGLTTTEAQNSVSSVEAGLYALAERTGFPKPTWAEPGKWFPLGAVTVSGLFRPTGKINEVQNPEQDDSP